MLVLALPRHRLGGEQWWIEARQCLSRCGGVFREVAGGGELADQRMLNLETLDILSGHVSVRTAKGWHKVRGSVKCRNRTGLGLQEGHADGGLDGQPKRKAEDTVIDGRSRRCYDV
jgi:hypothetical protein